MPILPFGHQFIEVPVADRAPGIKQTARFRSLLATQHPLTGEVTVQIRVQVNLHDEAGALLTGKGLSSYDVTLVADNNSAVDPTTGQVLHMRVSETDAEWQQLLAGKDEPLMLQGDWFEMLLNEQQVAIGPMLRQFIEQANQLPFSKFS